MATAGAKLTVWRKGELMTIEELAKRLDVSGATASRICNGHQMPGHELMLRIAMVTGGAVLPNDFFDGLPEYKERGPVTVRVCFNGAQTSATAEAA